MSFLACKGHKSGLRWCTVWHFRANKNTSSFIHSFTHSSRKPNAKRCYWKTTFSKESKKWNSLSLYRRRGHGAPLMELLNLDLPVESLGLCWSQFEYTFKTTPSFYWQANWGLPKRHDFVKKSVAKPRIRNWVSFF